MDFSANAQPARNWSENSRSEAEVDRTEIKRCDGNRRKRVVKKEEMRRGIDVGGK